MVGVLEDALGGRKRNACPLLFRKALPRLFECRMYLQGEGRARGEHFKEKRQIVVLVGDACSEPVKGGLPDERIERERAGVEPQFRGGEPVAAHPHLAYGVTGARLGLDEWQNPLGIAPGVLLDGIFKRGNARQMSLVSVHALIHLSSSRNSATLVQI